MSTPEFRGTVETPVRMELGLKTTKTMSQVFSNKYKEIAAFKRIALPNSYDFTAEGESSNKKGTEMSSARSNGNRRPNEYFVPKDGIDREVITADICRYLGNEALVLPGRYEVHIYLTQKWHAY